MYQAEGTEGVEGLAAREEDEEFRVSQDRRELT